VTAYNIISMAKNELNSHAKDDSIGDPTPLSFRETMTRTFNWICLRITADENLFQNTEDELFNLNRTQLLTHTGSQLEPNNINYLHHLGFDLAAAQTCIWLALSQKALSKNTSGSTTDDVIFALGQAKRYELETRGKEDLVNKLSYRISDLCIKANIHHLLIEKIGIENLLAAKFFRLDPFKSANLAMIYLEQPDLPESPLHISEPQNMYPILVLDKMLAGLDLDERGYEYDRQTGLSLPQIGNLVGKIDNYLMIALIAAAFVKRIQGTTQEIIVDSGETLSSVIARYTEISKYYLSLTQVKRDSDVFRNIEKVILNGIANS
jgi:hypothetical protein